LSGDWYSSLIAVACLIEGKGLSSVWRNVVVFQASDPNEARTRAVEIAARYRGEYANGQGELVRWAPKEIETLDYIGPSIVDAQEVWWEPCDLEPQDAGVGFDTTFDLGASAFAETGLTPSHIATRWLE
jgi:hypothetical protein